jgi:hypothetical protein
MRLRIFRGNRQVEVGEVPVPTPARTSVASSTTYT